MTQAAGDRMARLQEVKQRAQEQVRKTGTNPSAQPKAGFQPTDEQEAAVGLFRQQKSLKLMGYAGAAKTSTLELIARSTSRRGIYLAFNKAIVSEARSRLPRTVTASTTHSLAFRECVGSYAEAKLTSKSNANQIASVLGLQDALVGGLYLKQRQLGGCVLRAIERFCNSDDETIERHHVHLTGRLAAKGMAGQAAEIEELVQRLAALLWSMMVDETNPFPLGHSGYLKLWSLLRPTLPGEFILLDEAQDTNPCVIDVLRRQNAQLVFVGDPSQQIYQWRGAVDAMTKIPAENNADLTQSFRFGETLATEANVCLGLLGRTKPLVGNPLMTTVIGECTPKAVLARTNAGVISAALDAFQAGRQPHIVGGAEELVRLLEAVTQLKQGRPVTLPEFFGYGNWGEVKSAVEAGDDEDLKVLVDLVDKFGEQFLISMLRRCAADDKGAAVTLSTAHKAKGRQWDSVELAGDFRAPRKVTRSLLDALRGVLVGQSANEPEYDPDELRLLYVAMTRARSKLKLPQAIEVFLATNKGRALKPAEATVAVPA